MENILSHIYKPYVLLFNHNTSIYKFYQTLKKDINLSIVTCWRHQMETFSALLAICAGNSPVSG